MAVQTMILRPNGVTSITNTAQLTRVPSGVADENIHQLFNEEIPDDDATYVSTTMSNAVRVFLTFPVAQISSVTPTAIRLVARVKSETIPWGVSFDISISDATGATVANSTTKLFNENLGVYETVSGEIDNFDGIKDLFADATFYLTFTYNNSSGSKTGKGYLTQLYLEVDYDDGTGGDETAVLYLKKSGAWEGISGKVYNKVNGAWVDGTLDGLQSGGLVIVREDVG